MIGRSRNDKEVAAKTAEVLEALRKNREQHTLILQEARKGYIEEARFALETKLEQIRGGKIVDLTFDLTPPQDHTQQYNTAIKMLELHHNAGQDLINLTAEEVQSLVLDEWGWSDQFLLTNSAYSGKSLQIAKEKGLR